MILSRRVQMSRNGGTTRVPYVSGSDYPDELNLLLRNKVMIRRLKANVVDQLPPLRSAFAVVFLVYSAQRAYLQY